MIWGGAMFRQMAMEGAGPVGTVVSGATSSAGDAGAEPAAAPLRLDEEELTALYERVARPLRGYLRRLVANPALADDLLQETFYRFLRAAPPALDERQTTTYLYRTATRLAQDRWRRAAHERRWSERAGPVTGSVPPGDAALSHDLDRAFRELKPKERALLWLAHVEGAEHREIAEVLGVGEKSVKVLLFRARKHLARILEQRGFPVEDWR